MAENELTLKSGAGLTSEELGNRCVNLSADNGNLRTENKALRAALQECRDSLRWIIHCANGVGKSGGKPSTDEDYEAMESGKCAVDTVEALLAERKDGV